MMKFIILILMIMSGLSAYGRGASLRVVPEVDPSEVGSVTKVKPPVVSYTIREAVLSQTNFEKIIPSFYQEGKMDEPSLVEKDRDLILSAWYLYQMAALDSMSKALKNVHKNNTSPEKFLSLQENELSKLFQGKALTSAQTVRLNEWIELQQKSLFLLHPNSKWVSSRLKDLSHKECTHLISQQREGLTSLEKTLTNTISVGKVVKSSPFNSFILNATHTRF